MTAAMPPLQSASGYLPEVFCSGIHLRRGDWRVKRARLKYHLKMVRIEALVYNA
jgi:hypothetical protein